MSNEVSEVTRRAIIDYLTLASVEWSGRLREDEFLARLYDVARMPSTDYRFKDAAGDIRQHREYNSDWDNDWVFYDSRFNLLRASDEEFLRFLCETVHPVVRPDQDNALEIVAAYNRELTKDGWSLVEKGEISGRPIFLAQKVGERVAVFEEPTGWPLVDRQSQEIRQRLDTASTEEQFQAVGLLCREVLISIAQVVYDPSRHPTSDGVSASKTDAKRMLEAIVERELAGSINKNARNFAKASVELALELQHKRTADFRTAALCAEAAFSVVNLLVVLSGRRSRSI